MRLSGIRGADSDKSTIAGLDESRGNNARLDSEPNRTTYTTRDSDDVPATVRSERRRGDLDLQQPEHVYNNTTDVELWQFRRRDVPVLELQCAAQHERGLSVAGAVVVVIERVVELRRILERGGVESGRNDRLARNVVRKWSRIDGVPLLERTIVDIDLTRSEHELDAGAFENARFTDDVQFTEHVHVTDDARVADHRHDVGDDPAKSHHFVDTGTRRAPTLFTWLIGRRSTRGAAQGFGARATGRRTPIVCRVRSYYPSVHR